MAGGAFPITLYIPFFYFSHFFSSLINRQCNTTPLSITPSCGRSVSKYPLPWCVTFLSLHCFNLPCDHFWNLTGHFPIKFHWEKFFPLLSATLPGRHHQKLLFLSDYLRWNETCSTIARSIFRNIPPATKPRLTYVIIVTISFTVIHACNAVGESLSALLEALFNLQFHLIFGSLFFIFPFQQLSKHQTVLILIALWLTAQLLTTQKLQMSS